MYSSSHLYHLYKVISYRENIYGIKEAATVHCNFCDTSKDNMKYPYMAIFFMKPTFFFFLQNMQFNKEHERETVNN